MIDINQILSDITNDNQTTHEKCVAVGDYVRNIPTKYFRFKKLTIEQICNKTCLTKKEKFTLLKELLNKIR